MKSCVRVLCASGILAVLIVVTRGLGIGQTASCSPAPEEQRVRGACWYCKRNLKIQGHLGADELSR